MDEIATLASVSKQTVYKHFALYVAGLRQFMDTGLNWVAGLGDDAGDQLREQCLLVRDLRDLARRQLSIGRMSRRSRVPTTGLCRR